MLIEWEERSRILTLVRRAGGHCSTGPSGVADQSSARMHAAISLLPANTDSISCLSLGFIQNPSTRQQRRQSLGPTVAESREATRQAGSGWRWNAINERTRDQRTSCTALSGIQGKPTGPLALTVLLQSDAKLYLALKIKGRGEPARKTNTKVLVEIVQRICRDMVASTDRLEETLSAALLMCCPDQRGIRKTRAHRLPQTTLISRRCLLALLVNFALAEA